MPRVEERQYSYRVLSRKVPNPQQKQASAKFWQSQNCNDTRPTIRRERRLRFDWRLQSCGMPREVVAAGPSWLSRQIYVDERRMRRYESWALRHHYDMLLTSDRLVLLRESPASQEHSVSERERHRQPYASSSAAEVPPCSHPNSADGLLHTSAFTGGLHLLLTSNGLNTAPEKSMDERTEMDAMDCSRDGVGMMARCDASDHVGLAHAHAENGDTCEACRPKHAGWTSQAAKSQRQSRHARQHCACSIGFQWSFMSETQPHGPFPVFIPAGSHAPRHAVEPTRIPAPRCAASSCRTAACAPGRAAGSCCARCGRGFRAPW